MKFDYKNEFGEGIPFREGNPIQLLKYLENDENPNEYGEMILNEEALDIIREIDGPIAIIAVGKIDIFCYINCRKTANRLTYDIHVTVGSYRRGKSWFANVLHGRHDGFVLGSTV
jgi:guanylate-binding protein 1/3/4/7